MVTKPWNELALDKIEQFAHDLMFPTVIMWGEYLKGCTMINEESVITVAGLDRIISELRRPEEDLAKDYLRKLRNEIASRR